MSERPSKKRKMDSENETPELQPPPTLLGPSVHPQSTSSTITTILPSGPQTGYAAHDMVTLLVGPDQHAMLVHTSFITRDSDFFKAALKNVWQEGQTRTIKLPEDSIETVKHYLDFIYGEGLPATSADNSMPMVIEPNDFNQLANLYVFGERVLNRAIQNAVIMKLYELYQRGVPPFGEPVTIIYDGTPEDSPACRLLVDMHVSACLMYVSEGEHQAFMADLTFSHGGMVLRNLDGARRVQGFDLPQLSVDDYLV